MIDVPQRLGISPTQWPYIRFWVSAIFVTEGIMLMFNTYLPELFALIVFLFLVGFLLRVLHLYPGQWEPLILDASAVGMALLYTCLASLCEHSPWRFLLILTTSVIIVPHFIYIFFHK